MSPTECGLGNFLLTVVKKTCEHIQPVIRLGPHPSTVEDVGHERCRWRFGRGSPVWDARVIFGV